MKPTQTFKVQKNGVDGWHKVKAIAAQDAVEAHYGVRVYPYEIRGDVTIFDDVRDDVNQLYAAYVA